MFQELTRTAGPGTPLAAMARGLDLRLMLGVDGDDTLVVIRDGAVTDIVPGPHVMIPWDARIVATASAWEGHLAALPRPGFHDIFALLRAGTLRFEGNLLPVMQHLLYIKRLLQSLRPEVA